VEKEVWHLPNREFYNEALKAAREREKRWKYHEISATAMETKRNRENNTEIAKHFDDTACLSGAHPRISS